MSFTVAIIGRPNVGKSTLFNRLIGAQEAIVDDLSGVTRDRHYGVSDWNGKTFNIIDTGGFVPRSVDVFEKAIREQVKIAIEEASLIIFMTDTTTGITDLDSEVADMLRRNKKPVLLCVNKVDNHQRLIDASEFYSMGFEHTFFVSSMTGSGTGELLDELCKHIVEDGSDEWKGLPRVTIVGQPNVGKSSLLNSMIGEDRNIVTDIAGTTRDTIHTHYKLYNRDFLLIDTAGIRKKAVVKENLEFYSVIRAFKAIDESDVCILMIDAQTGIESQDQAIFRLIEKKRKGVVVLVNKWDLVAKETNTARDMEEVIRRKLAPFNNVPIIFISAIEKTRVFKTLDKVMEVYENRQRKIPTSKLNEYFQELIDRKPPPSYKGKTVTIKYVAQLPSTYPVFGFFCNLPQYVRPEYKQFLENRMREEFNFEGVPISMYFKQK